MGNMSLGAMYMRAAEDAAWERSQQALKDAKVNEEILAAVSDLKRRVEIAESKISDALVLMEDWDGEQFSQLRDVLSR
jgi:hypothetical protein